jgi:alpha-tubulin suppressor-like RCC1 family protein
VYGWGNGRIGQLGLGDRTLHWLPVPIKSLRKLHVTQIAAGYAHTIVVLSTH